MLTTMGLVGVLVTEMLMRMFLWTGNLIRLRLEKKKSYLEMKLLKSWDTTFTGMETNISQLSTNLENLKGSLDVEISKIKQIREELKNSFPDLDICSIPSTPTVLDDKSLGDLLKDLSKCIETQMDKVK